MALVITSSIATALFSTVDKIEINFILTLQILEEKFFHTRLAVHSLVLAGTAIIAFFVTRALDFRHYEKTYK